MKLVNTPLIQGLKAVYNHESLEYITNTFLSSIQENFLLMSVRDIESRTNILNMWCAFLKQEVTDYFNVSPTERKYHEDISFTLKDSSQKIIIREWQRSQENGIEIYSQKDEHSHFLSNITISYDGFCPFKQNLYKITQNGNLITVEWSFNPSDKDKKKWRKITFKLTDTQETIDINKVSHDVVNLVLSYLNEVSLSTNLKVTKKMYYERICKMLPYEKDKGDKNTLYEHLFQLRDLFNNRSTKGEAGTDYIIYRCISIILQNYSYPRNFNAVLNYEELFAVCSLYKHRLHELEKDANHNFEGSDINIELFKEVLDMYISYCSKDSGNFVGKGSIILSDKEYNPREASKMNHLKSTVALLSTYYFLSNPEELKNFCFGANIHFTDSLINTSVHPSYLLSDQYNFYKNIYSSIQTSSFSFRLFPNAVEKMKTNYIRKGSCFEIDKQLEKSDVNYGAISEVIKSIINQSEGVDVPISTEILSAVKKDGAQGEDYVLEVIDTLEVEILAACKKNIFCKTFVDKDDVEAIQKYILLNVQFNDNKYIIQNNLISVYHHISDTLRAYIHFNSWDYQKGEPPTTKDLLHELSSLASYLLNHAIESHYNSNPREAARLWRWEDIPEEMQTNKDTFIKLGIIRRSREKEGMYEFENQCCRLVLAALGQKCDNSQDALEHIDSFLIFYSAIAVDGTKNHLEYHMDDASIYITMFLLSLSEEKRDELITEMCFIAKSSISPGDRIKQEAYIFCLSLLLVQSQYQPSSKIRKSIFELFECNIYHDQILAFNDLKYKDPYYSEYPQYVFSKSLVFEENDERTYPPYYIYLLATTAPKLIGERKPEGVITFNAEAIEGADKIFDSFLRIQYLTWMPSSTRKITISEDNLLPLLNQSKKILVDSLESTPNKDTMKITYGLQALFMALSNVERVVPGNTQRWDTETKEILFECLIFSEYYQRKYNRFYNSDDISKGRFWMQCGGFRYIASLNIDISANEFPIVFLDERISHIVYPVFAEALKLEKNAQNWRFFYMLVRLLGCSDCFDYYEEFGKPIDIPKLNPLCKMDDIFMRYDNMAQWMESQHYV